MFNISDEYFTQDIFFGGCHFFQDKPLEFLSYFLLRKSSKKREGLEGNDILLECDAKVTSDPLMKVKVAVVFLCLSASL